MELLVEAGSPSGTISGPSAGGFSIRSGNSGGAREAQQMRAVDVDHVERDGDPGGAPRLGNELIGNQVRRHLVENPRDLERQW